MKKRVVISALAVLAIVSLVGCGKKQPNKEVENEVTTLNSKSLVMGESIGDGKAILGGQVITSDSTYEEIKEKFRIEPREKDKDADGNFHITITIKNNPYEIYFINNKVSKVTSEIEETDVEAFTVPQIYKNELTVLDLDEIYGEGAEIRTGRIGEGIDYRYSWGTKQDLSSDKEYEINFIDKGTRDSNGEEEISLSYVNFYGYYRSRGYDGRTLVSDSVQRRQSFSGYSLPIDTEFKGREIEKEFCNYTDIIFYNSTNKIGEVPIDSIKVESEEDVVELIVKLSKVFKWTISLRDQVGDVSYYKDTNANKVREILEDKKNLIEADSEWLEIKFIDEGDEGYYSDTTLSLLCVNTERYVSTAVLSLGSSYSSDRTCSSRMMFRAINGETDCSEIGGVSKHMYIRYDLSEDVSKRIVENKIGEGN